MKIHLCLVLLVVALPLDLSPARADDAFIKVTDKVPGHPGVSYFDLLKQIVPDLVLNGQGATAPAPTPFRNIAGPTYQGDPPDTLQVDSVEPLAIEADGKQRLLVIADFGATTDRVVDETVMGLFDDSATPKLLDVSEVALDRFTGFTETPILRVGPHDDAVAIFSSHSDSDVSFEQTTLVAVRHDKLALIDTFSTFGLRVCNFQQSETLSFQQFPAGDALHWPFRASILRSTARTKGDDCPDPRPADFAHKTFAATYNWDVRGQKYVTTSRQFDVLAKADNALNNQ